MEGLLGEHKPISGTIIARMQRWAIILSAYDYTFKYRRGNRHENADALSRLPLKSDDSYIDSESWHFENINLVQVDSTPVTADEVGKASQKDEVMGKVIRNIQNDSWAESETDARLKPYWTRRHELSVDEGCLLWEIGSLYLEN